MQKPSYRLQQALKNGAIQPEILDRFWSKASKGSGCWEWQRAKDGDGYGLFQMYLVTWRAHRLAYMFTNGWIEKVIQVQHTCNNPTCVNPKHLTTGDADKNNKYKAACGRAPSGNQHPARHTPGWSAGVKNGNHRLDAPDVRVIRALFVRGIVVSKIAKKFGINSNHVRRIGLRLAWKHLP